MAASSTRHQWHTSHAHTRRTQQSVLAALLWWLPAARSALQYWHFPPTCLLRPDSQLRCICVSDTKGGSTGDRTQQLPTAASLNHTRCLHPPPPLLPSTCAPAGAVHEAAPDADTVVVGVLPGPHANPDYFTDDAVDVFYSSPYQVHYNSNRWAAALCPVSEPCQN